MTQLTPEPEDINLMMQVSDGDETSFSTLYGRYHAKIRNFFFSLTRNTCVSADLSQETFLRIWKYRQRYTVTGSFPAYLFGFARNIWLEHCRKSHHKYVSELQKATALDIERFMATPVPEPDTAAGRTEINEHILDALDTLPEDQRVVFVLRSVEGLSLDEIAAVMHCPRNTVRSRQIIALKKLRRLLNPAYGEEAKRR
jgi:RNA polymerase sigma-70 factor (ECF subfamily)